MFGGRQNLEITPLMFKQVRIIKGGEQANTAARNVANKTKLNQATDEAKLIDNNTKI